MGRAFTRRGVVGVGFGALGGALIPFPEWLATYGQAQAAPPAVRHSAYSAAGAAMLTKYSAAVDAMTKRKLGDPCGWTFQWYTHDLPVNKTATIATLPAPQQSLATEMWKTCQAHNGPLTYFLPWHRMYAYFLERIVRKTCGDPNFTLPYWDYMTPAQRPIPPAFRPSAANPLYRGHRNTGQPGFADVNAGQPIDQGYFGGTLSLACMSAPDYFNPSPVQPGLSQGINGNPHGMVHDMVGDGSNMGSVPTAANDPIFWLHHANIDRLWASWNKAGGANPTDPAWRAQSFVFADENCNRVLVKCGDFEDLAPLNYTYDSLLQLVNPAVIAKLRNLRLIAAYHFRGPHPDPGPLRIALGAAPVVLPLRPAPGVAALAPQLKALGAGPTRLVVRDLQAASAPHTIYDVFLNLPAGASRDVAQAHFVGGLSFFGLAASEHAGMAGMTHGAMAQGEGPSASFDVAPLVRRLGAVDKLVVTISAHGRPVATARASVADVQLHA